MKITSTLKNKKGETLIETLVSLLVIVVILIMLPTAITVAAKINAQAEKQNISSEMDRSTPVSDKSVTIDGAELSDVRIYESNGFYFYDYDKKE